MNEYYHFYFIIITYLILYVDFGVKICNIQRNSCKDIGHSGYYLTNHWILQIFIDDEVIPSYDWVPIEESLNFDAMNLDIIMELSNGSFLI